MTTPNNIPAYPGDVINGRQGGQGGIKTGYNRRPEEKEQIMGRVEWKRYK